VKAKSGKRARRGEGRRLLWLALALAAFTVAAVLSLSVLCR
jgi:hypothetical protein